jgi:hypothetical protein
VLRAYLAARATFSDADFDGMRAVFVSKRLAAGEFLQVLDPNGWRMSCRTNRRFDTWCRLACSMLAAERSRPVTMKPFDARCLE